MMRRCDNGHAPLLVRSGQRCSACARRREASRATPSKRGYGAAHRAARATLRLTLPDFCAYGCRTLLYPNGDWVAAHVVDGDPDAGYIASCRTCNERAKARYNGGDVNAPARSGVRQGLEQTAKGSVHGQHRSVP